MITSFISDLLEEHEYVIIPGLGSFMSIYRPARFSQEEDLLLPPSQQVVFHPDVKENDGSLTNYLARRLKIPSLQAALMVEKFTDEVLYRLDHGEEVEFEKLGTLKRVEGGIVFSPGGEEVLTDAFGLEPVSVRTRKLKTSGNEPPKILDSGSPPRKFKKWLWFLLIPLFALIPVVVTLIGGNDRSEPSPTQPAIQDYDLPLAGDTLTRVADNLQVEQPAESPVAHDTLPSLPGRRLYYLIGGSFLSKENADKYFHRMERKGYEPIHLGKTGSFYLVAIDTFQTRRDAFNALNQYNEKNPREEVWIYPNKAGEN